MILVADRLIMSKVMFLLIGVIIAATNVLAIRLETSNWFQISDIFPKESRYRGMEKNILIQFYI